MPIIRHGWTIWMMSALVMTAARADSGAPHGVIGESPPSGRFMRAVRFALTGWDAADVLVVDRADCVFRLNDPAMGAKYQETYHLNSVDRTKLELRPRQVAAADALVWVVDVTLVGDTPVYERRITFGPRRGSTTATHYKLTINTDEYQGVVRAWKYVYSHGCTGAPNSKAR
jgi:hypothetical protein